VAAVVNINDVLDGHVALDLDCLDRIYLNAYVPNLQVGGQVVTFLTADAVAASLPRAERLTLEGQSHVADPKVVAQVLGRFCEGSRRSW
jgi:hypothetical protein